MCHMHIMQWVLERGLGYSINMCLLIIILYMIVGGIYTWDRR